MRDMFGKRTVVYGKVDLEVLVPGSFVQIVATYGRELLVDDGGTPDDPTDDTVAGPDNGKFRVMALTTTLQYELWKNVVSRIELRWDHLAGDDDSIGYGNIETDGTAEGTSNGKRDNLLIAANLIYKF